MRVVLLDIKPSKQADFHYCLGEVANIAEKEGIEVHGNCIVFVFTFQIIITLKYLNEFPDVHVVCLVGRCLTTAVWTFHVTCN